MLLFLLSCVWLFVTLRTTACQASLSFTVSKSLLKLMSIESVMPSKYLILCHPDAGKDWGQEEKGATEDENITCQIYKWKQNFHFMKDTLEGLYSILFSGHLLPQTLVDPSPRTFQHGRHTTSGLWGHLGLITCSGFYIESPYASGPIVMPTKSSDISLPSVCMCVSIHQSTDHVRKLGLKTKLFNLHRPPGKLSQVLAMYLLQLSVGLKTSRDQASGRGFHENHMKLVCSKLRDS